MTTRRHPLHRLDSPASAAPAPFTSVPPTVAGASPRQVALLLVFLVAATVASRLPQLLSPHLILDGDEAILSLMARRASRLESFPLYFDGQKYGLATIEALWAALHYAVLGPSALVLKVAMLSIWTLGAAFLSLALLRLAGLRAAWAGALLIVTCPGWGPWSMEARGGYLTAFLLVQICRLLLVRTTTDRSDPPTARQSFILGLCASGTFVAQPIWFLALAPWLLVFAWHHRTRPRVWIQGFAGATMTLVLIVLPGVFMSGGSWSPSLFNAPDLWSAVLGFPRMAVRAVGGAFYLRHAADAPPYETAALLWIGAFALAALRAFRMRGPWSVPQRATLAGALLVAGFSIPTLTPRYLLPLLDAFVFVLALQSGAVAARPNDRRANNLLLVILAALGSWCAVSFRDLVFAGDDVIPAVPSEAEALDETLELLKQRGVVGVYTLDPLLQWIVIDRTGEELVARWKSPTERTPIYIDRFAHLTDSGGRLALLAYSRQRPLIEAAGLPVSINEIAGRFLLILDPPRELLEVLGVQR